MVSTTPARDNEDQHKILINLIEDTFGNQLILGDIHAPMNKISDLFKLEEGDRVVGGWSIFHGFDIPTIAFPTRDPRGWESIKRMVEMIGHKEFVLPFPINMENDHGRRPWKNWPLYDFELMHVDKAMRITTRDIEVRDISNLPEIRAATEKDIPDLKKLYQKGSDLQEFEGVFHPLQLESDNYVVCVDADEIVAAAGTHYETPYTVQLGNIFVLPEYRGRGIGRAVTTAVTLGAIKTQRVPTLFVNEKNEVARMLYESIGFEYYLDFAFYRAVKK